MLATVPDGRDSFLSYQLRRGDLPLLGRTPVFRFFELTGLALGDSIATATPDFNAKGVPLASPRWQLQLLPSGLASPNRTLREYLRGIEDIQLVFDYQAFNL